jgi:hypothetical protein
MSAISIGLVACAGLLAVLAIVGLALGPDPDRSEQRRRRPALPDPRRRVRAAQHARQARRLQAEQARHVAELSRSADSDG